MLADEGLLKRVVIDDEQDIVCLISDVADMAVSSGLHFISGFRKSFRFSELNSMPGNIKSAQMQCS